MWFCSNGFVFMHFIQCHIHFIVIKDSINYICKKINKPKQKRIYINTYELEKTIVWGCSNTQMLVTFFLGTHTISDKTCNFTSSPEELIIK